MASQLKSIATLVNEINNKELALPDLQRDFVWDEKQIRMLLDSIMRDYPFGSLLFWNTQFLEVVYRNFSLQFRRGQPFDTLWKAVGLRKRMVLDGQQRLQSLYLAFAGTYDGRRLFFNITSGPDSKELLEDDDLGRNYRFEFWSDHEPNRPKRLIPVSDVVGWSDHYEDDEIDQVIAAAALEGDEASLARRNLRLLRRVFTRDLVPIMVIDDDVIKAEQAKSINEILEIFVRVNDGGTRLSKSDLMFSLIKTKWVGAREHFDSLQEVTDKVGIAAIDKDFIIRGLLTISEAPTNFDVAVVEKHWEAMEAKFPVLSSSLRCAIDFCRSQDVRILSSSLLEPVGTLLPVVYFLSRQKNSSVPDSERSDLRALIYFLLFNRFLAGSNPASRIRYLRDVLKKQTGPKVPLDQLLDVIAYRQQKHSITTTPEMLGWNPRLALNIAQPAVAQNTLSWQERAEVDHIFPQSLYRPLFGNLVDDIGNLAYLGKLRNIRKSNEEPWIYFKRSSEEELSQDLDKRDFNEAQKKELSESFLIEDTSLLIKDKFLEFIEKRRSRILETTRMFLGR